jgi:prefoldin subunit 5
MSNYNRFLDVMSAVEDRDVTMSGVVTICGCGYVEDIGPASLEILAEEYRKLEKERDELQDSLDSLKRRLESVLEDF